MTVFLIPTPGEAQPFADQRTTLDGREYVLAFAWNQRETRWYLRIADESGDDIASAKIVPNVPLFRRVRDERTPPGWIVALSDSDDPPTLADLVLYYYDAAETLLGNTSPVPVREYVPQRIDMIFLTVDGNVLTGDDGAIIYLES